MAYKLMDWSGVMFLSDSHSDGTHSLQCIRWWDTDAVILFYILDLVSFQHIFFGVNYSFKYAVCL